MINTIYREASSKIIIFVLFLFKYSFRYPLPKLKGKFDAEIFLTKLQPILFLNTPRFFDEKSTPYRH